MIRLSFLVITMLLVSATDRPSAAWLGVTGADAAWIARTGPHALSARARTVAAALRAATDARDASGAPVVPNWEPTYDMRRSTIVMPCNLSGWCACDVLSIPLVPLTDFSITSLRYEWF